MSDTCDQCGTALAQSMNFCRKCGAPAPTETLATMPLQAASEQPTQEIEQIGTDTLKTDPVTRRMAETDKTIDPFDTWEPTKAVAAPVATEVLASAPLTGPTPPTAPALANSVRMTAPTGAPAKMGLRLAAAAAAMLILTGGGWFLLKPTSIPPVPTTDVTAAAVENSVAETSATPTPLPSPVADESLADVTVSPTPDAIAAKAKPTATIKAESKTKPGSLPSSTPNASMMVSAAVPEPTKTEPAKTLMEKSAPAASNASWLDQGNRLVSAGQFQEAIQMYEKARRANPGNTDVYYLLGSAYHRSGDLTNALDAYRKCTTGNYAQVAANHVKKLEKKLNKNP